jgi:GDP-L-fucose synthase
VLNKPSSLQQGAGSGAPSIYVAGHQGLVGSAIVRALRAQGHARLVTRTHAELELTDQAQVRDFFRTERIDQVYLAAARVGGIHANNTYPAEFIYDNMMVQANVVHEAWRAGVHKLLSSALPASTRAWRPSRSAKNT